MVYIYNNLINGIEKTLTMNSEQVFILQCKQKILNGQKITVDESISLINVSEESL